jgi:hypothetical protein
VGIELPLFLFLGLQDTLHSGLCPAMHRRLQFCLHACTPCCRLTLLAVNLEHIQRLRCMSFSVGIIVLMYKYITRSTKQVIANNTADRDRSTRTCVDFRQSIGVRTSIYLPIPSVYSAARRLRQVCKQPLTFWSQPHACSTPSIKPLLF